jgi:hypothetical protein
MVIENCILQEQYLVSKQFCGKKAGATLIYQKSIESCVGTKNLVFCSGYNVNAPTLFLNLQKRSLVCR